MRPQIPVPSKGDPLRATWGAQVTNRVNELCAMAPAGALHREGFGGIGDQPLPKNLRDRRGGAPGQPMPFDIRASIETSQDGTQQRLVVKWYYPDAAVVWNLWPLTAPSVTPDSSGWVTVYTGQYASTGSLDESVPIELWYTLEVSPDWTTTPPDFTVTGDWEVIENSDADYSDEEFDPVGSPQTIVSYVSLGTVEADGASVAVRQSFHGELHLHDLLVGTPDPAATPFQYNVTETTPEGGGAPMTQYSITNCRFYWDGEYHTLADFTNLPATGTIFLAATKSGSGAGSWSFALSASGGSGSQNEATQYVKLYDFSDHKVTMDYRTTTLMFGPGPRDYFRVRQFGSQATVPPEIELDATQAEPQIRMPQGSGVNSVEIIGGTQPAATFTGNSGAHSILTESELYTQGTNRDELDIAADGGDHNISLRTRDATQGDVSLVECDYYAPNASQPVKVNVMASATMTLGSPQQLPNIDVVTGIGFSISGDYLVATLTMKNLRTAVVSTATVNIFDIGSADVVTDVNYTAPGPNCNQEKKTISVIGTPSSATTSVAFTTTPLSSEMAS